MKKGINELGCHIIKPKIYTDNRGYFFESYNKANLKKYGISTNFVQDNESFSTKNVLRGLHFQVPPSAQAKLVRVTYGKVLDIAVDIRANSLTFGDYCSVILSDKNKKQLFIPKGYAHGFVVLSDKARFCYKCDTYYDPKSERGIRWDDPDLEIDWKISKEEALISDKDSILPKFSDCTFINNLNW
ncbi:MAG: dTDP-4-dehydrorhamnose 3,5-epimerase [Balneola sp.]|nr:dTDP-4-dehydrorhamnose 3,5-epimerase [Balneola sp.]|tara:strand:- start:17132 stop:17689 length:558 start_codon:yes stop_codon:yes gene_type:complete